MIEVLVEVDIDPSQWHSGIIDDIESGASRQSGFNVSVIHVVTGNE